MIDALSMFFGPQPVLTPALVAGNLVLSCLLSLVFALVYQYTFRGFTYSRSYIHTMVIGSMVTCMLIMAVGNNLARGMGILGTLAIIRFRTPVRDPRDAMFLFACLGVGISCGAGMPLVAAMGTGIINLVALFLHWTPFASRREYEGMLRFTMPAQDDQAERDVQDILVRYCSSFYLLGMRDAEQGNCLEFSYQVRLLDPAYQKDLVEAFKQSNRFEDVVLLMQRTTIEL
ncbi:MAG: DUF4956 domain-containing protein [Kiritimatiellae bacterium]|jgi:uncharacterized membrane protein YhiD involved in acid resistance|nr:DUF4956 domain-containing protein [Kiritimatiellia bacterium]NLD90062.1 DUF4956 domain-containing protein [Lentisphaerota bacterium]HPC20100.1 DUF4956 domain-containing protein [Kiritimatiellia bacterium]HQN79766.1 DUF4956 domain-containing protein [Kiritimatiellia bacterium]